MPWQESASQESLCFMRTFRYTIPKRCSLDGLATEATPLRESQRDSTPKPRVDRNDLPSVKRLHAFQRQRRCAKVADAPSTSPVLEFLGSAKNKRLRRPNSRTSKFLSKIATAVRFCAETLSPRNDSRLTQKRTRRLPCSNLCLGSNNRDQ